MVGEMKRDILAMLFKIRIMLTARSFLSSQNEEKDTNIYDMQHQKKTCFHLFRKVSVAVF